jgi:hypothetical protein
MLYHISILTLWLDRFCTYRKKAVIMGFLLAAVSLGLPTGQSSRSPERSSEVSHFGIQVGCIMLSRQIITVYFEHHTTSVNVLCDQNADLLLQQVVHTVTTVPLNR